jgi:hypothetical protein
VGWNGKGKRGFASSGRAALNALPRGPPLRLPLFATKEITQEEHMKQIGVYCLTLSTVLLTATPTRAALDS